MQEEQSGVQAPVFGNLMGLLVLNALHNGVSFSLSTDPSYFRHAVMLSLNVRQRMIREKPSNRFNQNMETL